MKKLVRIILAVLLAFAAVFSMACGDSENAVTAPGLRFMKFKGDDFYTVYGYGAEDGVNSLDIGKIAADNGVVIGRIKTGAFVGNSSLTEIIVPDTVSEIESGAFKGMEKLEKITLPFVGSGANADPFDGASEKAEDKVVDGNRNFGYVFGTDAYDAGAAVSQSYGSGDAVTYYIPHALKEVTVSPAKDGYNVPMYAFYGCTNLYTVNLSDKVAAIGEKAFYGCANLVSVKVSANLKNIYASAFEGCDSLKDYNAEKGTGLNFNGCTLDSVGEKAFYKTALKSLSLSVETIGDQAFAESKLQNLTLFNVKLIGAYAFYKCESLTAATITAHADGCKRYVSSFEGCGSAIDTAVSGIPVIE